MVSVKVNFQKKDLWLLSAIVVFLVGVGFVVAYGGNTPAVMGHSAGELEINVNGTIMTLQQAITNNLLGGGGSGSSSTPYYRVKYLSAIDKYALADFASATYQTKLISYGEIRGEDHEFIDGSYLLEMRVNVASPVTKTLKVMSLDNRVDFFMDGSHIAGPWSLAGSYASDPTIKADFTMNPGEHTIQIIFNAQGSYDYMTLWGDIIDNTNVQFVGF